MVAERTFDADLIAWIMTIPEIWDAVSEDGMSTSDFTPEVYNECWISVKVGETLVALYNYHAHNSITVEIHVHVIPEHRKEHAVLATFAALQWLLDNEKQYKKVVIQIPEIYKHARYFSARFGFILEGTNRKSFIKNGNIVDRWLMGATTEEIMEAINV